MSIQYTVLGFEPTTFHKPPLIAPIPGLPSQMRQSVLELEGSNGVWCPKRATRGQTYKDYFQVLRLDSFVRGQSSTE